MSNLFLITGASGAGKSTILKALLEDTELPLERFVTTTTRDMRPGEVDGRDYWFVSRNDFERDREKGDFFESAEVYGNLYGSHKSEYARMKERDLNKIMVIDIQGAKTLKRAVPEAVTIFIDASAKELENRLRERGAEAEEMKTRLAEMKKEKAYKQEADYVVLNVHGKLDEAIQLVKKIILSYL